MSECAWMKCRKPLPAGRHSRRFCTKKCAADDKNWRMMRGAPLVSLLIPWRASRNWSQVQKAAWEARHNRPVPSITDIARLVDAMIAEQREGSRDA